MTASTRPRARSTRRPLGGARRAEGGAAFVEAVLIIPFLITLLLAVFELGTGWRAQMTVSNALRSGARVASNLATDPDADRAALQALAAGLGSLNGATVNWVTIYQVTGTDITPPSACTSTAGIAARGSQASSCNTYSAADLAAVKAGSTSGFGNCNSGSSKDRNWCPTSRGNNLGTSVEPDLLGISVSISYPSPTRMFGTTRTVVDRFAMRLEPNGAT